MIKIYSGDEIKTEEIMSRGGNSVDVSAVVKEIIENVRKNGDAALCEYAEKFDGALSPANCASSSTRPVL